MNNNHKFISIDASVLPDAYEKVLEAKQLLESGNVRNVSEATKATGISRSTFYKYKDIVYDSTVICTQKNATFFFLLSHLAGVLSNVLALFSSVNANILTISQSVPIGGVASVMLTVELSGINCNIDDILTRAAKVEGVKRIQLIAID